MTSTAEIAGTDGARRPRVHHIGVQTNDLANSLAWYEAFLGCRQQWSLESFSDLTRSRLPGIKRLVEVTVAGIRLHLFERAGAAVPAGSVTGYQHVCVEVDEPDDLVAYRDRWTELYRSGRYAFARDEPATAIVTDADGIQSFYAYDVNGLELEFTYVPAPAV